MKRNSSDDTPLKPPDLFRRLAARLHLLRSPECRAESTDVRAIERALSDLPRFTPPSGLSAAVLSIPRKSGVTPAPRRERTGMRRLAYATVFLIVIALLVGGIIISPQPKPSGSLLLAAAQAMGLSDTLHVRGQFNLGDQYDPWAVDPGSYERWYSPDGFRFDFYDTDGDLTRSVGGLVSTGEAWQFYPGWLGFHMAGIALRGPEGVCSTEDERPWPESEPLGTLFLYQVGSDKLAAFIGLNRDRFADGDLRLASIQERGHLWQEFPGEWQGRQVAVIEEDLGPDIVTGQPRGFVQYYLEPDTGRFVGLSQYGPEADGSVLEASVDLVDYDVYVPPELFTLASLDGIEVLDGQYYTRPSGDIMFLPGADDRIASLTGLAAKDRHFAAMGARPWEQAESSHLAVLEDDPDNYMAREYLGRMYTRWGLYEDALELLPEVDCGPWSALNRAFCYDALGQRDRALELYEKLKDTPHDSIAMWACRGLQHPTWPADLDLKPDEGEFLLKPRSSWKATAFNSSHPNTPDAAIDGDPIARWGSGGDPSNDGQAPGNWFQLDFTYPTRLARIVLDHQGIYTFYTNDWPRGIVAEYTSDGTTWHEIAASPGGPMQPVTVRFDPPETVRTIRFETTKFHSPEWWSIHEIYVYAPQN